MAKARVKQNIPNGKYVLSHNQVNKINQGIYKISSMLKLGLDTGFEKISQETFYGLMYGLHGDMKILKQDFKPKICPFSCFPLGCFDDLESYKQ